MLNNTNNGRAPIAVDGRPIQIGPSYRCFAHGCGRPALDLIPWPLHPNPARRSPLDRHASHIAYLQLPRSCEQAGHPIRVARLGLAITPLSFPPRKGGDRVAQQIEMLATLREALAHLAAAVPEDERDPDPITALVYGLLAGRLAPDEAVEQIRLLTDMTIDTSEPTKRSTP